MNIHTSKDANKKAGERISELLAGYKDVPVLLMLSGGSAFSVLEYIDLKIIDARVSIALIDERINVADEDSNAWQLVQIDWYQQALKSGAECIVLEDEAIKKWKENNKNGKIIALLGMGSDGHIAGILPMPNNEELFNRLFIHTNNWVTEYKVNFSHRKREGALGYVHENTDNPFKERITITAKFLITEVENIILYEIGESKCKRLKALEKKYAPHIEPADILTRLEKVVVYTDCV